MAGLEMFSTTLGRLSRLLSIFAIAFALMISSATSLSVIGCQAPPNGSSIGTQSLRVGTSGDYAPFSLNSAGKPNGNFQTAGFSIDVARAFASHTGRRVEFVQFNWPKLSQSLAAEHFDFALSGITVRPDRSIAGRFSHPLTVSGAVVLTRTKSGLDCHEDLRRPGLTFAVNAGGHLERTTRALFPEAIVEAIPANHLVLDALDRNEVDAVVTDSLEAPIWLVRRAGLHEIGPLTRDRKAAWFPVNSRNEMERFDAWLLKAEASGELGALRAQHGLPQEQTALPGAALLARLDERLSLMIDVAKAKAVLGAAIEDLPREERVLDAAVASIRRASKASRDAAPSDTAVRRLYRAQIEAAKTIQRQWTAAPHPITTKEQTPEAARRALDDEIRPALIYLGDRLAELLVQNMEEKAPAPNFDDLKQALGRHGLPERDLTAISDALEALLGR